MPILQQRSMLSKTKVCDIWLLNRYYHYFSYGCLKNHKRFNVKSQGEIHKKCNGQQPKRLERICVKTHFIGQLISVINTPAKWQI
jgi:hypothetical protein